MKKLLALMGTIMMIGSSATAVVSCAGSLETHIQSYGLINGETDYEI